MQRDLSHFQDRENAIEAFDNLWEMNSPWILAFNGVAGQGKSTLLDWLEVNRCLSRSIPYASLPVGDFSSSFHTFLARIAESTSAGFSRKDEEEFKRAYDKALADLSHRTFQLRQNQILEGSPESRQTMTANIAEAVRALENQCSSVIIEHWLRLIRTLGKDAEFVLLLDNYDVYQDLVSLNEIRALWMTLERARQFVSGFRVILASREAVRHQEHVESLRRGLNREGLQDLSKEDSKALLNALEINDNDFCDAVYRLANGHPLITQMAAEAWKETPGGISVENVPNISGREKIVEWLQIYIINRMDEVLRPAAQSTMLLRWFSFEILNSLLETPLSDEQYRKLTDYSFIIPSKLVEGYKAGHDLVRKVQIAYLKREQKTKFLGFHKKAYEYFRNAEGFGLEMLYHQFFTDPDEAFQVWQKLESKAAFRFDHNLWGLLHELGLREELDLPDPIHAEILSKAGRRHYYRAEWFLADEYYNEALKLFKEIGAKLGEANVRKAIGDVQQFRKELNAALESYNEALKLFKEIGDRLGEANTLQSMGKLAIQNAKDQASFEDGMGTLQSAMTLYEEIQDRVGQINILMYIARVMVSMNQNGKALEVAQSVLPILIDVAGVNHPVTLSFQDFIKGLQSGAGEAEEKAEPQ